MSDLTRRTVLRVVAGTTVAAPVLVAEASPHPSSTMNLRAVIFPDRALTETDEILRRAKPAATAISN